MELESIGLDGLIRESKYFGKVKNVDVGVNLESKGPKN